MTDSGAAAANTINTIAPVPREPCKRLRSIGLAGEEDEGGMVETGLRAEASWLGLGSVMVPPKVGEITLFSSLDEP
jgi:hypothetical protein